jgi:hypothetical protein
MSSFIKFDRPLLIRDGKGTVVYEHAAFARAVEDVKATAAIGRGEAVIMDQTNSVLPRWDYSVIGVDVNFAGVQVSGGTTNSPCVLAGVRVATATSKCYLGVAMENIATGVTGHVCVDGISAAKCVNPPNNNVLGNPVIGHATPGLVDAVTTNPIAVGICLGSVYVIAGTAAGSMGSLTQLGVLINPR